jgi:dTDP-4-amino-4,6-dideoxygalactose transaminase
VRDALINYLKAKEIHPVFHYLSLHLSEFYKQRHDGRNLPQTDRYSDCLLRLPFYYELEETQVALIVEHINQFFKTNS